MDFFSSVFSTPGRYEEEGEEEEEVVEQEQEEAAPEEEEEEEEEEEASDGGGRWSFGGLIKTFASRSESVMESYRRDIQDLGSGLRLETAALRAAAARAAAALPGALEAGASAASDSLESVGQVVDDLGAAAAVLLSHANEALLSAEDDDGGDSAPSDSSAANGSTGRSLLPSKRYTRLEAQVLALRADPATFTEDPEDAEGFAGWRESFRIDERREEIEGVLRESPGLESFVERLVPGVVDYETFWCRYFFAVDKLKQAEDVRVKLVNRAMAKEEEEELSWDIDDEDNSKQEEQIGEPSHQEVQDTEKQEAEVVEKDAPVASGLADDKKTTLAAAKGENGEANGEGSTPKSSNGTGQEEKTEAGDSSKDSDFSVVSRPSMQEEDLSWEEIEDVGDQDEKKAASPRSSSPHKVVDLQKRLNAAEGDEELSWDVEDEDAPAKP